MRRKKYLYPLFLSIFFALLTACGGDFRNRNYTIAYDPSWLGIELMGQQNNVTGFSMDLMKEIEKLEKTHLSLVAMNWDTLVPNLKSQQYDAILSSIYPYLFNQTYFDFSSPYLLTGPVLVLPINSTISSIEDLNGAEIGVLPDTLATLYLEKNPEILIRNYDSIPDALNDVAAGVLQGAVIDNLLALAYCSNIYHDTLRVAGPPMNDHGIRLITLGHPTPHHLIRSFDDGLTKLKKTGVYQKLLEKWSLE